MLDHQSIGTILETVEELKPVQLKGDKFVNYHFTG